MSWCGAPTYIYIFFFFFATCNNSVFSQVIMYVDICIACLQKPCNNNGKICLQVVAVCTLKTLRCRTYINNYPLSTLVRYLPPRDRVSFFFCFEDVHSFAAVVLSCRLCCTYEKHGFDDFDPLVCIFY